MRGVPPYLWLGLLVAFVACSDPVAIIEKESAEKEHVKFPVIIDQLQGEYVTSNVENLSRSWSGVLFIGEKKDTIEIDGFLSNYDQLLPPPPSPFSDLAETPSPKQDVPAIPSEYMEDLDLSVYPHWSESQLQIIVDPLNKIKTDNGGLEKGQVTDSWPVLIENIEGETIQIGYGSRIPLIAEAQDSSGNWMPIEKVNKYRCGTGLNTITLPPNKVLLTSVKIYEGDYQTKMRVRIGNHVSNEYDGSINYSQFYNSIESGE